MTLLEALAHDCPVGAVGRRLVYHLVEWHTRAVAILEEGAACPPAMVTDALARSHALLVRLEKEDVTA